MGRASPELLATLLDQHAAALELYARGWCFCPDDVVQDALLQLVRQPAVPENVVAWLYRVVRNGSISAARSDARRRRRESLAAETSLASTHRRARWFTTQDGDRLDAETATAALEALREEWREPVVAHIWGGLSFEEIGELIGCSSSTAHRRYVAGLAALRERLGVSCPNDPTHRRETKG